MSVSPLSLITSLKRIATVIFYVAWIHLLSLLSLPWSPKVGLKRAETWSTRCVKDKTRASRLTESCTSRSTTALSHVLSHTLHHVSEHLSDWVHPASTSSSLKSSPERLREHIVEVLPLEKLSKQVIWIEALSLVGFLAKPIVVTSL